MAIFCPGCGAEAADNQQYCRKCGVNLFLIGKALNLGESIARGDRGPLPKVKAAMEGFRLDKVSEDIGRNLDQVHREIVDSLGHTIKVRKDAKTDKVEAAATTEQLRASNVLQGAGSLFAGVGMMIAFYMLASTVVLRIPPEQAARIPFEVEPVVRMAWILGLVPALRGLGMLIAAALTRPRPRALAAHEPERLAAPPLEVPTPPSVTEHTTEFLDETDASGSERDRAPLRATER